jgi:hypothetical protein
LRKSTLRRYIVPGVVEIKAHQDDVPRQQPHVTAAESRVLVFLPTGAATAAELTPPAAAVLSGEGDRR